MSSGFKLQSKIPELAGALRRDASRLIRTTAFHIEGQAKILAPVDTGALRNSIQTTVISELEAEVSVGVEYGIYQELGTTRMPPQPFLGPSFEEARKPFEAGVRKLVKK